MKRVLVHMTGGDGINWALDEDLRQISSSLTGLVEFCDLPSAEVVHSASWYQLLAIPPEALAGKTIVCNLTGHPLRLFGTMSFRKALDIVQLWVSRASQGHETLKRLGVPSVHVPYLIDQNVFTPLSMDKKDLRAKYGLPSDAYLIGNFHRDSEGFDLNRPKPAKGPDVFAEILALLYRAGHPVHAVLAGPRRHWLRKRLAALRVPFVFIGDDDPDDDIGRNILPRTTLNELYNALDLCLCSSRSEGGPHSLLEATASGCKVISSDVGIARDLLDPENIFTDMVDAVRIVADDIQNDTLRPSLESHTRRMHREFSPEKVRTALATLYEHLSAPSCETLPAPRPVKRASAPLTVSLWHKFVPPPWGGGNQFMMALQRGLLERGFRVVENQLSTEVDVYVLNSVHFDVDAFRSIRREHRMRVVHRIDGPIQLIRGADFDLDRMCFTLNKEFADLTILQSAWSQARIAELGFSPVRPIVVHNAVDPQIFFPGPAKKLVQGRKLRIISSSWSNNHRKGGPIYKWLDQNLDWSKYEYTFVGRCSEPLKNIRTIPPVDSNALALLLREHDVYITASANDPCSNALIEAQACGLPAVYLRDGGHPELVGCGGLPFDRAEEIPTQLRLLAEHYESFLPLVTPPSFDATIGVYSEAIRDVAGR